MHHDVANPTRSALDGDFLPATEVSPVNQSFPCRDEDQRQRRRFAHVEIVGLDRQKIGVGCKDFGERALQATIAENELLKPDHYQFGLQTVSRRCFQKTYEIPDLPGLCHPNSFFGSFGALRSASICQQRDSILQPALSQSRRLPATAPSVATLAAQIATVQASRFQKGRSETISDTRVRRPCRGTPNRPSRCRRESPGR
jgi:hypothetical protein